MESASGGALLPERVSVWRRVGPVLTSPGAYPRDGFPAGEESGAMAVRLAGGASAVRGHQGAARRVWRPKSLVQLMVHGVGGEGAVCSAADAAVMPETEAAFGDGQRRSRRRRRPRFRQPANSSTPADPGPSTSMSVAPPEAPAMPMPSLPCIINWDDRMARAEEDLANAVTVTVCGAEPLAPVYEVAEVLAARLGVEASSLVLRQASNSSYLLVLPDIGFVQRLLDHRQPPLRSPAFTLLCKRWSRLAGASGRMLPWLLDVELRGIPAHVWETSTVEKFLSPLACIQQVHPDTVGLRDLVSFKCSAWCLDPSALPPIKELWVSEPPVAAMDDLPVKRLLSYPVETRFSVLLEPGAPPPPPLPHTGGG
jgi:hypothetical protein